MQGLHLKYDPDLYLHLYALCLQASSDRCDQLQNFYHDDVGDYMFANLTIRLQSLSKAMKALSAVHCCATTLRRMSLKNDLVYGILAQRYDGEQAAFYWWMRQEAAHGCLKAEEDGTLKPETALRKPVPDAHCMQTFGMLQLELLLLAN